MIEYLEKAKLYNKLAVAEEKARKTFLEVLPNNPLTDVYQAKMNQITELKHMVADEQSSDVAPVVHGEWVDTPDGTATICSYCKADWNVFDNDTYRFKYCPNCGAKMDLED